VTLYEHLSRVAPSPIVDLNRAIAVSFSEGPDAGLTLLDTLHLDAYLGSTTCCTPRAPTSSAASAGQRML
jgi:predicted RNA polymerase sigma factor